MPYSREWNESRPPGSGAASDIDTFIQHVQTDVRERIEQVIPGWGDDAEDPKRSIIQIGDIDARPIVADAHTGEFYFSLDEDPPTLYIFNGTAWIPIASPQEGGGDPTTPEGTFASGFIFSEASVGKTLAPNGADTLFTVADSILHPEEHIVAMWRTQFLSDSDPLWSHWLYGSGSNIIPHFDDFLRIRTYLVSHSQPDSSRHNMYRMIARITNDSPIVNKFITARFQVFAIKAPSVWNLGPRTADG